MKRITFTYTDLKDKVTTRTLLATSFPGTSDKYAGIDISSLSDEEQAFFIAEYKERHNTYLEDLKDLQEQYDLKHNYRQFLDARMSSTEIEEV